MGVERRAIDATFGCVESCLPHAADHSALARSRRNSGACADDASRCLHTLEPFHRVPRDRPTHHDAGLNHPRTDPRRVLLAPRAHERLFSLSLARVTGFHPRTMPPPPTRTPREFRLRISAMGSFEREFPADLVAVSLADQSWNFRGSGVCSVRPQRRSTRKVPGARSREDGARDTSAETNSRNRHVISCRPIGDSECRC